MWFHTTFENKFIRMKLKISLVGAGGKMGMRLIKNLVKTNWSISCLEVSPEDRKSVV